MLHPESALLNPYRQVKRKVMKLNLAQFAKESPMGETKVDAALLKELVPLLTKVKDNMSGLVVLVSQLDPFDQFERIGRDLIPFKNILSQTLPVLKKANFKGYPLEDIDTLQGLSDTMNSQKDQFEASLDSYAARGGANVDKIQQELREVAPEFQQVLTILDAKLQQFNASGSAPAVIIGAGFGLNIGAHHGYEQYALPRRYL